MYKIAAIKGDRVVVGKISAIYSLIRVDPETIRRWARRGLTLKKNGWDIYTKVEEL